MNLLPSEDDFLNVRSSEKRALAERTESASLTKNSKQHVPYTTLLQMLNMQEHS